MTSMVTEASQSTGDFETVVLKMCSAPLLVSVPARISTSARRITLHLPEHWPWEKPWAALFEQTFRPRKPAPT